MGVKKTKGSRSSSVVTKSKSTAAGGSALVNGLKWLLAVALLAAAVIANGRYATVPWALRATGGILVFAAILAILYNTSQGAKAWGFIKLARMEMRKVVWPTRPEVMQTTLMVMGMVLVTALVLWGLDTLFLWGIGWLVGQRG